jgi:hypothetical protein
MRGGVAPTEAAAGEEDGGAIAEIVLGTSFDSMSSLTADDPPQLLYCQGISNKQSFFQPHVISGVVWMEAKKLWRSTKCTEEL